MPRQTRASVVRSLLINAYVTARAVKTESDSERIAAFMKSVLESPKVKGTSAEPVVKAWDIEKWKQKITGIRAWLTDNTASVDGKVKRIFSKQVSVTTNKEVEVDGEKKIIPETSIVTKYFMDDDYKVPMPENALNVKYPSLWGRKMKAKKDKADLISAIESLDNAIVVVDEKKD